MRKSRRLLFVTLLLALRGVGAQQTDKNASAAGSATAYETGSSEKKMSSEGNLKVGKGKFSLTLGSSGMAVKTEAKEGVTFDASEDISNSDLTTKAADISSGANKLTSVGEKAAQSASKKKISVATQGQTTMATATTDATTQDRQGLTVQAEKGLNMTNSATLSQTERESEATTKKEGATEAQVRKETASQLQSQSANSVETQGKSDVSVLGTGANNKMKVKADGSSKASTSLVANQAKHGTLEGTMNDGKSQKKTLSTFENNDQVSAQLQLKGDGPNEINSELDVKNEAKISGDNISDTKFTIDKKNTSSKKVADAAGAT